MEDTLYERLLQLVDADPFVPIDVRTSDGRVYTIDPPDYFARSRRGHIVTYITEDDRFVNISVGQVVAVEVANRPAA
ncbi:MAG TPA: hypothetical protein VGR35_05410 [Tepidisphaeraceae bacterium]|nr:hypothetical protein [Tepidisphaeraceae bacterium]